MHHCLINLPEVINEGGKCDIFECLFGLKPLHVKIYFYALKQKRTIKEIADFVERDRSTAVRLVQRLIGQTLFTKEIEMLPNGGMRHIYSSIAQEVLKERLRTTMKQIEQSVDLLVKRDWRLIPDRLDD
ncbi:MAG: hypothetical protein KAS52_06260 [Candidatus Heimdallarchaeota archaeon]|nr:hypothetical protein [Candidatus Heimdallarchaeota archaeon]